MKKKMLQLCMLSFILGISPLSLQAQQLQGQKEKFGENEQVGSGNISLDIKGMDIVDVLKILAMRGNLNIAAGKNVRGKVTVFLKDVKVMDALKIILAANELAYAQEGEIINVMSSRDYEELYGEPWSDKKSVKIIKLNFAKAVEVAKALSQIKTKIGKVIVDEGSNTIVLVDIPDKISEMEDAVKNIDFPTVTKTFVLNYAKAKDIEATIKESLSKTISEIKIDERMNKIIVTDLPDKIEYVSRIISDFDERDKVVLIEAKIVQITLNKDLGYGINWNNVFAGIDTVTKSDLSINLSGVTPATTFTYTRAHGATNYGDTVILRLLEKLGKTNVLSTPRITVANNQEAKVLVGTKEAYVTSTITQNDAATTTADNVQFIDVGVSLSVTPTINEDGFISMKIKPEVSSAPTTLELTNSDGSVRTSVPIVTTSEAETQLLVKDGTTIIMAGLMKDSRKDNAEKIPLLGDVPLLGHFFRSRGKETEKIELVIFLTPHIISGTEDSAEDVQRYIDQSQKLGVREETAPVYTPPPVNLASAKVITSVSSEQSQSPQTFQQYCNYISDKVKLILEKNTSIELKGEVQLSFMLSCDGALKGKPCILNSVDTKTHNLVMRSIEQAAPFFPFPLAYNQPEETFRLTICF